MNLTTKQQSKSETEQEQNPVAADAMKTEPPKPPTSRVPTPLVIVGLTAERVRELLTVSK